MAKTLKETPTRSESAETKPLGVAMSLNDPGGRARCVRVRQLVKKKTQTQMLSTPIAETMKKRLNRLRLEHSISTAFVLEAALNAFFGDRSDDAIASELLARGGRLRRNSS